MVKQIKVLKAAVTGTSVMTIFSYIFSGLSGNNTREPELLGKMVRRGMPGVSKANSQVAGWAVHYLVGLLFAEGYAQLWERSAAKATPTSGLVFGGLSGIAAILIWKFTLAKHPFATAVNFRSFSVNLFVAHLIFGFFAAVAYGR